MRTVVSLFSVSKTRIRCAVPLKPKRRYLSRYAGWGLIGTKALMWEGQKDLIGRVSVLICTVAYAWELVEKGHAFVCYRTPEELNALREARRESGKATALKPSELRLSEEEQAARKAAGASFVIRMMVPEETGACVVRGHAAWRN